MSFAKPKQILVKQSKTHKLKELPPTPSSLQKSTAYSVAGSSSTSSLSSRQKVSIKKGSPHLRSLTGCRNSGVEDASYHRQSLDALYGKCLISELAVSVARRNAEVRAKEVIRKDCTMLWAALSAQRTRVSRKRTGEDETIFLEKYVATMSAHKESLKRLLEVALNTALMVGGLTMASTKTQNCLQIYGVTVQEGDFHSISRAYEKIFQVICDLCARLKYELSSVMAESLGSMQEELELTVKTLTESETLVKNLKNESTMLASINFSAKGRYMAYDRKII